MSKDIEDLKMDFIFDLEAVLKRHKATFYTGYDREIIVSIEHNHSVGDMIYDYFEFVLDRYL